MKPLMLVGAVLAALGIIALVVGGAIPYTSQEQLRGASAQITTKHEKVISIPPLVSGLVLAGGIALMVIAARE
jgi:hypothetical protein